MVHLEDESFLEGYNVGGIQSADLNNNDKTCVKLLNTPSDIVFMDDVVPHVGCHRGVVSVWSRPLRQAANLCT